MRLRQRLAKNILVWLLATFFLIGAVVNLLGLGEATKDYARWGYPDGFHWVTGTLELTTAALLLRPSARLWGAVLGCLIMAAASATVLASGEQGRIAAPLIVLTLCAITGWLHRRRATLVPS